MNQNSLPYWLAANYLPGIGPRTILRCLLQFGSIDAFFLASKEELEAMNFSAKQIAVIKNPDWQSVERDLVWAEQSNQVILSLTDVNYPALLKEISDPPLVLYVRGNASILNAKQIAIVGARNGTVLGLKNAEQFAYELAQYGLAITSGLALGIDGAAHQGALKAKGMTIGVAGTGLLHNYPSANRHLMLEMLENNGAIISEFSLSTPPRAANFPRRNRIISGLSIGVLVVEAALKSGSLITVKFALEQSREIFAIPGSIHHPLSKGCHHLIRQGAKLVETAGDILEELQGFKREIQKTIKKQKPIAEGPASPPLEGELREIFDQITHEITPIDMIILQSGLTPGQVSSILLKLELDGYIQSVTGGYLRTPQV